MDFASLNTSAASEKPRTIIVKLNGEPTDVEIDIIGSHSQKARRAQAEHAAKTPKIEARIKQLSDRLANLDDSHKDYPQVLEALTEARDQKAQAMCRLLAQMTCGWRNLDANGVPVEFSEDVAEQFYAQSEPMFLSVLPEVADTGAFLGNVSSGGSNSGSTKPA